MGSFLNFVELLAVSLWLGPTLYLFFLSKQVRESANARMRITGIACSGALAFVQLSRGLLWYWGGLIRPALVIFGVMCLLQIWKPQVSRFGLVPLLLYVAWMSTRGY